MPSNDTRKQIEQWLMFVLGVEQPSDIQNEINDLMAIFDTAVAEAEKRGREAELKILDHSGVSETVVIFIERHNKKRRAELSTRSEGGKDE